MHVVCLLRKNPRNVMIWAGNFVIFMKFLLFSPQHCKSLGMHCFNQMIHHLSAEPNFSIQNNSTKKKKYMNDSIFLCVKCVFSCCDLSRASDFDVSKARHPQCVFVLNISENSELQIILVPKINAANYVEVNNYNMGDANRSRE